MPFGIINPAHVMTVKADGQAISRKIGRKFTWGFADSLDPKNSDFSLLAKLICKYLRNEIECTMQQKFKNLSAELELEINGQQPPKSKLQPYGSTVVLGLAAAVSILWIGLSKG